MMQGFHLQFAQATLFEINLHAGVAGGQQRNESAQVRFMADEQNVFRPRTKPVQLLNQQLWIAAGD